jgi:hypothetical protein
MPVNIQCSQCTPSHLWYQRLQAKHIQTGSHPKSGPQKLLVDFTESELLFRRSIEHLTEIECRFLGGCRRLEQEQGEQLHLLVKAHLSTMGHIQSDAAAKRVEPFILKDN